MTLSQRLQSLFALAAAVGASPSARAQVPSIYVPTQRAQPFVALANGTPVGAQFDSAVTIPIGFEFTYSGRSYAHVSVGENGAVALQPTCDQGCNWDEFCSAEGVCDRGYFPPPSTLPSQDPPNPVLAAWWDDLQLDPSFPPSEISYELIGVEPDRELVIEYENMRRPSRVPSTRATFQIRLSELTGEVRMRYGPTSPGQDQNDWSGAIGIESIDGSTGVPGLPCAASGNRCPYSALMGLTNQVITFGVPNGPELAAAVDVPAGALPGGQLEVQLTALNLGRSATPTDFSIDVYLAFAEPVLPGRDLRIAQASFPPLAGLSEETLTVTATIPLALAPGYFFVAAVVDPDRRVTEASELNNVSYAPKPVPIGEDVGGYLIEALPAAAGETVPIHFELFSLSSPRDVSWSILVSNDDYPDPADLELAAGVDFVASGETLLVEAIGTMPDLPPSYVRYLLVVDPRGEILELDELNNLGQTPPFPTVTELVASWLEAPSTSGPGEPIQLRASVQNWGPAATTSYRAILSSDLEIDPSDAEIAAGELTLEARAEVIMTIEGTVPLGASRLVPYYVLLELDPHGSITEVDELNNVISAPSALTLLGPDVGAPVVAASPRAFRGVSYEVIGSVVNIGAQSARGFTYRIQLSRNRLVTEADPILYESEPFELGPGGQLGIRQLVTIPDLEIGPYFLAIVADPTNVVDEDRETNNIAILLPAIEVMDPSPDFAGTELRVPGVAASGEAVTFARSLENFGNAPGHLEYSVRLISLDARLAATTVELGRSSLDLGPGESSLGADTFEVPVGLRAGVYAVEYVLDPDEQVVEIEEANNRMVSDGVVELEPDALRIRDAWLPVAVVGQPYSVTLQVSGATGALNFAATGLPQGIELDAGSGALAGTPVEVGQRTCELTVSDGFRAASAVLELTVVERPRHLEISTAAIPAARPGARYEYPVIATGGVPPYRFSASGLPREFVMSSTGALTGTAESGGWSQAFEVEVRDHAGAQATRTLVLRSLRNDRGVRFTDAALPDAVAGEAYRAELEAEGGRAPYLFAAGELPAGLLLEGSEISGEPARAGTFVFAASVLDSDGGTEETLFVLRVEPPETPARILTTQLPPATKGVAYVDSNGRRVQVRAVPSAVSSSVALTLVEGSLPPGLSLAIDGTVSGTPTATGVFAFLVLASDASGSTALRALGIQVGDADRPDDQKTQDDGGCDCSSATSKSGPLSLLALLLVGALVRRPRLGASSRRPAPANARKSSNSALAGTLLAFALFAPKASFAAADPGPYVIIEEARPYVPMSGGSPVPFPGVDDAEVTMDLPFPFAWFDSTVSQISIGTNGMVTFVPGEGMNLNNESLLSPGERPNSLIAVFWDDMFAPRATTQVLGESPNRVFVIEWTSLEHFPGTPGQSFDMQLHLHEGPAGRFELHYGASTFDLSEPITASAGFEDPNGTLGAVLLSCSPSCGPSDFEAQIGRVIVVTMDAGQDVIPSRFEVTSGPLGRVYVGAPIPAYVELRSATSLEIGPFRYEVRLVDESGNLLDPIHTSPEVSLQPYETYSWQGELSVPASFPVGRYGIALFADSADQVAEPNEVNNRLDADASLVLLAPRPNFVAKGLTVDGGPASPGSAVAMDLELENSGVLPGSCAYTVVLSANRAPSVTDRVIATGVTNLLGGERAVAREVGALPANLGPGTYRLALLVDPDGLVEEIDELDNSFVAEELRVGSIELGVDRLPAAFVGLHYQARVVATGVTERARFSLFDGELPEGFELRTDGAVTGIPSRPTLAAFSVQVEDGGEPVTLGPIALEVFAGEDRLAIVSTALAAGVAGQPYPVVEDPRDRPVIEVIGARGELVFSARSLPAGLLLDVDGYLHGAPAAAGEFEVEVEVTDGFEVATRRLPLRIVPSGKLTLVSGVLPEAVVGEPYSTRLEALGGPSGPASFRAARLPEGLSLGSGGELTGTPAALGTFRFRVEVEQGQGVVRQLDSGDLVLVVLSSRQLSITPTSLPPAVVGSAYEAILEARLGVPPYSWSVEGEFPAGIFSETIGLGALERVRIFGTPLAVDERTGGLAPVMIEVRDALGEVARIPLALLVTLPPPAPEESQVEEPGCGCRAATARPGASPGLALMALLLYCRRHRCYRSLHGWTADRDLRRRRPAVGEELLRQGLAEATLLRPALLRRLRCRRL